MTHNGKTMPHTPVDVVVGKKSEGRYVCALDHADGSHIVMGFYQIKTAIFSKQLNNYKVN